MNLFNERMIWRQEKILTSKILIVVLELALLLPPLKGALLCTAIGAHAPISAINLSAALSVPMKRRTAKVPVTLMKCVPGQFALRLLEVIFNK